MLVDFVLALPELVTKEFAFMSFLYLKISFTINRVKDSAIKISYELKKNRNVI